MRTELESGAWVEHRPIQDLKGKDRDLLGRLITAQLRAPANGGDGELPGVEGMRQAELMAYQRDVCWAMMLTAWSWDGLPLPQVEGERGDERVTSRDSFGELLIDDFDELLELFSPYLRKFLRVPDPKGTTTSSSNGSSRARATGSRKG